MQPHGCQGYPRFPRQIQRSSYSVAFDERFSVPLDPAALEENSLRFSVFGVDEDERSVSTGVAELKLSDLDLATRPFNAWLYLQDTNKVSQERPSVSQPDFGMLLSCPGRCVLDVVSRRRWTRWGRSCSP